MIKHFTVATFSSACSNGHRTARMVTVVKCRSVELNLLCTEDSDADWSPKQLDIPLKLC